MAWRSPAWAPTQREVKWNHLSRACFCVFINSFPNQNHTLQNPFPGRHQAIDHERQASPSIFTHPSEELQQLYSESANSVPASRVFAGDLRVYPAGGGSAFFRWRIRRGRRIANDSGRDVGQSLPPTTEERTEIEHRGE